MKYGKIAAILAALLLLLIVGRYWPEPVKKSPGAKIRPPEVPGLNFGAINVPLAVLWTEPGMKRDYDSLILGAANNPAAWAGGMDLEMRLWLVNKVETQALFGERVAILERRGDWLKVTAISQRTGQNKLGYPGWLPAAQVSLNESYLGEQLSLPEVVVAVPLARLFRDSDLGTVIVELSCQTRLPLIAVEGQTFMVRLPDGSAGYLAPGEAKRAGELVFSAAGAVEEARQFLGLPYLWGGTSSYGFDCSGFTFRILQSQGLSIPRDADEQAREGVPVVKENLRPGDLLFFAAKEGRGQIHHVGIYSGGGRMVHAPNSSSSVREEEYDAGAYGEEYWGARRYAP